MPKHYDGEILGLDSDGCIIQWDGDSGAPYNCGETPEQFGIANITEAEAARLGIPLHSERT
jgi:hypothetical protein